MSEFKWSSNKSSNLLNKKFGIIKLRKSYNLETNIKNKIKSIINLCCDDYDNKELHEYLYMYLNGSPGSTNDGNVKLTTIIVDILSDKIISDYKDNVINMKTMEKMWSSFRLVLGKLNSAFGYINFRSKNSHKHYIYKIGKILFLKLIVHNNPTSNYYTDMIIDSIINDYNGDQVLNVLNMYHNIYDENDINYKILFEERAIIRIKEELIDMSVEGKYLFLQTLLKYGDEYLYENLNDKIKICVLDNIANFIMNNSININKFDLIDNIDTVVNNPDKINISQIDSKILGDCFKNIKNTDVNENKFLDLILNYYDGLLNNNLLKNYDEIMQKETYQSEYFVGKLSDIIKKYVNEKYKELCDYLVTVKDPLVLRNIIRLSEYFNDKEYFVAKYEYYFYNKLFNQKTEINVDDEYENIKLLNTMYNDDQIQHIKKMMIDIINTKVNNEEYKQMNIVIESEEFKDIDFDINKLNVNVLSLHLWNFMEKNRKVCCDPPIEVEIYLKSFKNYYEQRRTNKILDIDHLLSEIVLEFNNFTVKTNALQAYILLLFNNNKCITHDDITKWQLKNCSGIADTLLTNVVESLVESGIVACSNDTYIIADITDNKNLVEVYNKITDRKAQIKETIDYNIKFKKDEIMKARIMSIIKVQKTIDKAELYQLLEKQKLCDTTAIDAILQNLQNNDYFDVVDDIYTYIP
jgi:hypothetical protein